jgi:indolepyruvate ferredoxin oxidoreductase beta subunit
MVEKQDILLVGVGGQGIILASDILGEVALQMGLDVKKTDTLGMAQRGGSVTSHLRIGEKVWAPLISLAEADIIVAFEKLEAARWAHFIKPDGLVIINDLAIPPLSISLGTHQYPGDEEILNVFKQRTDRIHLVPGSRHADSIGDIRTLNIFMLGLLSAALPFRIDNQLWEKSIAAFIPKKIVALNMRAFNFGREVAESVNI